MAKKKPAPEAQTPPLPEAGPGLVPLSVRVRPLVMSLLKYEAAIRKLGNQKPDTMQDCVAEALEDWLVKVGQGDRLRVK